MANLFGMAGGGVSSPFGINQNIVNNGAVAFGGSVVQGTVSTGNISNQQSATATGGQLGQSATAKFELPIPGPELPIPGVEEEIEKGLTKEIQAETKQATTTITTAAGTKKVIPKAKEAPFLMILLI